MAHPKRRHSRTRGRLRRAHDALSLPSLAPCSRCSAMKEPHRVCPNCGTYKGEEIIAPRND